MTTQKRNDEMVELLRPDFFARYEPNASMVHASMAMQFCAGRGYWPCSANRYDGADAFIVDVNRGFDLELAGRAGLPQFSYENLYPFVRFVSANGQYATYLDDPQFDILGTETYVATAARGLTISLWVRFTTVPASVMGLFTKWGANAAADQSYGLWKTAANAILFGVNAGAGAVTVTSAGTVTTATWYHIWGRYVPSTSLTVAIDNVQTQNLVGVPAALLNGTANLDAGSDETLPGPTNFLNGDLSQIALTASSLSDAVLQAEWEQTRAWFSK